MTSWPQPTRKDHEAFFQVEEWRAVRDARGRTGTHHVTYELGLDDGKILRTRISHPVDRTGYGRGLWNHILRDQLDVDEPVFWSCVQDGVRPARGTPEQPAEALPADLVHLLISRVGLVESEVAGMSKDEAVARMQRYWTDGG
ncbi:cytotoxic translational repressor of toxin-antitoxin stability system [Actinosynnema sp. NPDC023658]|uniref:cytotoxic translational repressor of toxin-antitoxin stability system n=1 Tax=Actinosynnema sp. NPDC023658 TaxID=3155465 RepID=UPI0033D541F4